MYYINLLSSKRSGSALLKVVQLKQCILLSNTFLYCRLVGTEFGWREISFAREASSETQRAHKTGGTVQKKTILYVYNRKEVGIV